MRTRATLNNGMVVEFTTEHCASYHGHPAVLVDGTLQRRPAIIYKSDDRPIFTGGTRRAKRIDVSKA